MFINPKYPGITATELSIKNWVIAQSAPYVDSIRAIYSKDTAVDANEYRVAFRMLRTTTDPASGQLEDYHFWVQTNSGLWAQKNNVTPSVFLGFMDPNTDSSTYWPSLNSNDAKPTYYFAVNPKGGRG